MASTHRAADGEVEGVDNVRCVEGLQGHGHEVMYVHVLVLERAARREVDVSSHAGYLYAATI